MAVNSAFPFSMVDLEMLNDTVGVGDFIPLRDGRQVEVLGIRIQGVSSGLPIDSSTAVLVTVKWQDTDTLEHFKAEMPLNILFDVYVHGNFGLLSAVDITPTGAS